VIYGGYSIDGHSNVLHLKHIPNVLMDNRSILHDTKSSCHSNKLGPGHLKETQEYITITTCARTILGWNDLVSGLPVLLIDSFLVGFTDHRSLSISVHIFHKTEVDYKHLSI
jgi:hypothetical protein